MPTQADAEKQSKKEKKKKKKEQEEEKALEAMMGVNPIFKETKWNEERKINKWIIK